MPFKSGAEWNGNRNGRPKGKTLKEFAREFLATLPDDEKIKYLKELPKEIVWRMAEGNPAQDLTSGEKPIKVIPIYGAVSRHNSDSADISDEKENTCGSGGDIGK